MLEQILIPGRFYGGSVTGHFSLSAVVQPGASMQKMDREVLGSNLSPDKEKSARTEINSWPILWGVGSGSFFSAFFSGFESRS